MLNDLLTQLRRYDMLRSGDSVTCAVSGGADSMALLWGLYLLKDSLQLRLSAAHFNHHLRGEESDRDEAFVREFCERYEIPLTVGGAYVQPGEKGLEAAAREARYAFFATLPGKIATAHTADDNAETVLMHLVRGTGLKGLGGIAPVNGAVIRPMLGITRHQVEEFLAEYHIGYVQDSSNGGDGFLRNRLRHHVMPLLTAENPRLAENVSAMAQRLRLDEQALEAQARYDVLPDVSALRKLPGGVQSRMLERFLKESGVKEPEAEHIRLAQQLVFSGNPSARASFPGGVTLCRSYDRLIRQESEGALETVTLPREGTVCLEKLSLEITVRDAQTLENSPWVFTVRPKGELILRCRQEGDQIRLPGGTKTLKKLFIDRKIPASQRLRIPVLADDDGILAVAGFGVDQNRAAKELPAVQIHIRSV